MFQFRADDTKKLVQLYGAKNVSDVSRRALRDTGNKTRTAVSKEVRKVYNVSAAKVREKSFLARSYGTKEQVDLVYKDNRPNLGRFGTAAKSSPRVKIKKTGGTKVVKGGFRLLGRGTDELIWKRLSAAEAASPKYAGRKVKIKVLRTIAVPEMVRSLSGGGVLQKDIQAHYDSRFDYHFRRRLGLT